MAQTSENYQPLSVLIADDHHKHRRLIRLAIERCQEYQVLNVVNNGQEVVRYLNVRRPDIILLDDDMPIMNGLETLRAIRENNQKHRDQPAIKVIMLQSAFKQGASLALRAIEKGAHGFIPKPSLDEDEKKYIDTFVEAFLRKAPRPYIRKASVSTFHPMAVSQETKPEHEESKPPVIAARTRLRLILIGSSTGGPPVLRRMLPQMRKMSDTPVILVQHISEAFTKSVAENMSRYSGYQVVVPEGQTLIEPGHLYLAPGGKHLIMTRDPQRRLAVRLNNDPPVHSCKPSVDVMFSSAAKYLGDDALALILTGMGGDGADGAKLLKARGTKVLVQDRESSVVWGMPGAAVHAQAVDHILSPTGMLKYISEAVKRKS